jgi:hypothetical protein
MENQEAHETDSEQTAEPEEQCWKTDTHTETLLKTGLHDARGNDETSREAAKQTNPASPKATAATKAETLDDSASTRLSVDTTTQETSHDTGGDVAEPTAGRPADTVDTPQTAAANAPLDARYDVATARVAALSQRARDLKRSLKLPKDSTSLSR